MNRTRAFVALVIFFFGLLYFVVLSKPSENIDERVVLVRSSIVEPQTSIPRAKFVKQALPGLPISSVTRKEGFDTRGLHMRLQTAIAEIPQMPSWPANFNFSELRCYSEYCTVQIDCTSLCKPNEIVETYNSLVQDKIFAREDITFALEKIGVTDNQLSIHLRINPRQSQQADESGTISLPNVRSRLTTR